VHDSDFDRETALNLKDLLRILRKRRALILTVFLGVVTAATIISFLLPKVYEAETTLRVKQTKGLGESLLSELPMGNPLSTKQQMSTYAEIIKSRTVITRVIRLTRRRREKPLSYQAMLGRIVLNPVRDTEILKLQVRGSYPQETQIVANTIVEVFLERLFSLARSEQTVIREFIAERLKAAKKELAQAEKTLENYKNRHKIVIPAEETKNLVTRLADLHKLVAENQIELATAQARLEYTKQQLADEKRDFIAENPLIEQLRLKLMELEVELASLAQKYTDNHPQTRAVRAAIAETKQKLSQEVARVINAEAASENPIHQGLWQNKLQTEAELSALIAQKHALDAIVARGEKVLTKLPATEQGLMRIMRNVLLAQEIYVMLAKRYEEARISEAMQPTGVQVIDRAEIPERPIGPKRKFNITVAAFLGLLSGIGLALILEYLYKVIVNEEDVARYLDLPVLGNIPDFKVDARSKGFWKRMTIKG
jgi:succinoglycan biosynthesis transport protein ExoP